MCWFYDGLRLFRQIIPHSRRLVNIEDMIYWLCMTVFLFYLIFTNHRGEIRNYTIVGIVAGCVLYLKAISPVYLALLSFILKPFKFLFSKVRKGLRKITVKYADKH